MNDRGRMYFIRAVMPDGCVYYVVDRQAPPHAAGEGVRLCDATQVAHPLFVQVVQYPAKELNYEAGLLPRHRDPF